MRNITASIIPIELHDMKSMKPKNKITFSLDDHDFGILRALMISRMFEHKMPKQSDIICEAIRLLGKDYDDELPK